MTEEPLSRSLVRHALAGAAAAAAWAAQQPLDKRVFRFGYDDTKLLGTAVVPAGSRAWLPAGVALHLLNGAVFGAMYGLLRRSTTSRMPMATSQLLAQVENVGLFPLTVLVDRYHPASRRGELPKLWGSRRALAQATWRHALFGVVLGWLVRRGDQRLRGR